MPSVMGPVPRHTAHMYHSVPSLLWNITFYQGEDILGDPSHRSTAAAHTPRQHIRRELRGRVESVRHLSQRVTGMMELGLVRRSFRQEGDLLACIIRLTGPNSATTATHAEHYRAALSPSHRVHSGVPGPGGLSQPQSTDTIGWLPPLPTVHAQRPPWVRCDAYMLCIISQLISVG